MAIDERRKRAFFVVGAMLLAAALMLSSMVAQMGALKSFPAEARGSADKQPWFRVPETVAAVVCVNTPALMSSEWSEDAVAQVKAALRNHPLYQYVADEMGTFDPDADLGEAAVGLWPPQTLDSYDKMPDFILVFRAANLDLDAVARKVADGLDNPVGRRLGISLERVELKSGANVWKALFGPQQPVIFKGQNFQQPTALFAAQVDDFLYFSSIEAGLEQALGIVGSPEYSVAEQDLYKEAMAQIDQDSTMWGVGMGLYSGMMPSRVKTVYLDLDDPVRARLMVEAHNKGMAGEYITWFGHQRRLMSRPPMDERFEKGLSLKVQGNKCYMIAEFDRETFETIFQSTVRAQRKNTGGMRSMNIVAPTPTPTPTPKPKASPTPKPTPLQMGPQPATR